MSKPIKGMLEAELRRRYAGVESACVVELVGMEVKSQEKLRRGLREKSAHLHVLKNSLARRAFKNTTLAPIGDALEGPCAIVSGSQSLIEVAKVLVEAAKEFKRLKLKWALFDGDPRLMSIEELSKMRGLRELLGELSLLAASPGRAIAGCIGSPQAKIAGCLKTLADKAA